MVDESLPPGVEHRSEANLRPEALAAELQQRLADGLKEQTVERGPILSDQPIERMRQGKNQVEVRDRQQQLFLGGQPLRGGGALTLGAVPVSAGMDNVTGSGYRRLIVSVRGSALAEDCG